jgi:hypothetical protein
MSEVTKRTSYIGLLICISALIAACGSKITQENFDKVKEGMTFEEVKSLLGAPSDSSSAGIGPFSGTTASWKDKKQTVTIVFINGKVTAKTLSKT